MHIVIGKIPYVFGDTSQEYVRENYLVIPDDSTLLLMHCGVGVISIDSFVISQTCAYKKVKL